MRRLQVEVIARSKRAEKLRDHGVADLFQGGGPPLWRLVLVDEQGAHDLTRAGIGGTATRSSRFESLLVTPSIVFVRKRPA